MTRRAEILAGVLLTSGLAAWIAAAVVVATGQNQHWTSPVVLGLIVAGCICVGSGGSALSPLRLPSRMSMSEATLIGVAIPDRPCIRYPFEQDGRPLGEGCYCHLEVRSLAPDVTLRGCRARLIKVERAEDQAWIVDERFTAPVRLKWAHANVGDTHAEARDVEPDLPQLLDVVHTAEFAPDCAFLVSLDVTPVGLPKFLAPGIHRLTVRVSAENSPAVDYAFLLIFTSWTTVTLGTVVT